MKKILLFAFVIFVCFGYMTYSWLHSHGWTIFSQEMTSMKEESVTVSTSTSSATPLLFVGDIMLGRYVEMLSNKANNELYPFQETKEYLKRYITIANLEGPIPALHKPTPINGFSFSFSSSSPRILREGGITAVSLANNHMFDQGKAGYEHTKSELDKGGVLHFGGYAPTENDYFETKVGTTPVIVYGITMIATGWNETQAHEITRKLRAAHPGAYLIAFVHWGDEYSTQNKYQRAFGRALIDEGVDAIIGSHPHIVQGVELYKNKPIFYSLGNFIFDQYWEKDTEEGLMVKLSESDIQYTYELIPVSSSRSVPSIATSTKRDDILLHISKQSEVALEPSILLGSIHIAK
jgi:poly-gamma-glutamate capsule biosynthesis protein CapA/YwtB (metallophosphatase superfamily)